MQAVWEVSQIVLLVVDDDRPLRALVKAVISNRGVSTVIEATNGLEAMKMMAGRRVHGVFCDVQMNPMNGLEFLRRVRNRDIPAEIGDGGYIAAETPIVMLTGYSQKRLVEEAIQTGATGYLTKPIKPAQLIETVDRILTENQKQHGGGLRSDGRKPLAFF